MASSAPLAASLLAWLLVAIPAATGAAIPTATGAATPTPTDGAIPSAPDAGTDAARDVPDHSQWRAWAASRQAGLHLLEYAGLARGEPVFRENGVGPARTAGQWLNVEAGARPGVFFFGTADRHDPQERAVSGPRGRLTPPVRLTCRGGPLLVRGFAYFNATRVTCRCPGRLGVDLDEGRGTTDPPRPRAHVAGVLYNEGDLVLARGFTVIGAARAGGELELRGDARIVEHPSVSVPPAGRRFPSPEWKDGAPLPTSWPLGRR